MEEKSLAEQTEIVLNSAISEGTAEKQTADILEVLSYLHRRLVVCEAEHREATAPETTPEPAPAMPEEAPADEHVSSESAAND